ncbi:hypothetical protein [Jeotgalibacillus proteolyticus]|uniref:Histidine phosphatase family protein n=1 Tax=Jeotgalibacillus proteolyticus TaxID=2082395 RepID=A0A2S5GBD5_9BACL|nr:hypothetical protein [Jeotgalibacillus proteolyticus]PPA70332.1 hypothetical protein C4B60_12195 [Jeotgalibacillus proteolyticus]
MEISLIRHGITTCTDHKSITYKEFTDWVRQYDDSGVFEEDNYPVETGRKIDKAAFILTSDLKRSIESAKLLNCVQFVYV